MYWKHSYCAELVNHTSGSFRAIKMLVPFFHWAVHVLNKLMHTIHNYSAELCNMLSWLWKPEAVITRSKMHPQPRQSLLLVKISHTHYYMCNGRSYFQSNYLFQRVPPKTNYRMHDGNHEVIKTSNLFVLTPKYQCHLSSLIKQGIFTVWRKSWAEIHSKFWFPSVLDKQLHGV